MTIDWSKAPEGATHLTLPNGPNRRPVFWRVADGTAREAWPMENDFSVVRDHFRYGADGCASFIDWLAIPKPAPWNGEGLPPVGKSVCEYLGANQYDEWSVVNIFAHLDNIVFVEYGNGWRAERDISRFRPIRTAEQIAEDERSDFASQLVKDLNVPPANEFNFYYELGERLHKLGYRKQVAQ